MCEHRCPYSLKERNVFYFIYYSKKNLGRVAQWLATCAQKPEVPGLSPATSYIHGSV